VKIEAMNEMVAQALEALVPAPGDGAPWQDAEVWDLIAGGRARGVHHIESPAMLSLARMCDCRDIDTLVAIVSVIRPGAANSLRKIRFARRARGLEEPEFAHPCLEPILRSTHGVVAYEEHILQICEVFAGMSPGRADLIRRSLVKNRLEKMEEHREEFARHARSQGRTEEEIAAVWELVFGFRGYAFCRAHSTAYALEAYAAAVEKTRRPAQFLAAVLTHEKGFYSPLVYTLECRLLGIGLRSPCVNGPVDRYLAEETEGRWHIRVPLRRIKDLPARWLEAVRGARAEGGAFRSLADLVARTGPDAHTLRLLLRAGALDEWGRSRAELAWQIRTTAPARQGQSLLFAEGATVENSADLLEEPSPAAILGDEMELLGFTVRGHPLDLWPDVAWDTYCPVAEIGRYVGQTVTVGGLIVAHRDHHQKDGRAMKFLTICDRTGMVETEVFAEATRRFGVQTLRHPVLGVTGRVQPLLGDSGFSLEVERLDPPRRMREPRRG
jgi:DNA polymerase III alpha subunit